MPLKPHPTDPDKMVYVRHQYDFPKERKWVDLDFKEVDLICEKYKDQPYKLYVEIRNLLKDKNA